MVAVQHLFFSLRGYSMKFSKLLVIFATLSLLAGVAVASEVKKGDKDKDGHLDKMEAKAFPMLSEHFEFIDTDKDGTLDANEVAAFFKK